MSQERKKTELMRTVLSLLFGAVAGYISQNIAASEGYESVLPFILLGLVVAFVCRQLTGVFDE